MKLIPRDSRHGISIFRLALALTIAALVPLLAYAAAPAWWSQRGVLVQNGTPDDYALVNQGQLKNIARAAVEQMDAWLPGGAGDALHNLVQAWASPTAQTDDFAPVNLGQLKNVAKPFYDRLIAAGLASGYPWSASPNQPDDFALANIGQVKKLFNFDVPNPLYDSDSNGLPDAWEQQYFGHLGVDPNADPDGDGLTNLQEYQNNTAPDDFYNSASPQLVLLAGDGQIVKTDSNAPRAFELLVLKTDGTSLPNAPVTFAVTSGEGLLASDGTPGAPLSGSMTVRADFSGRVRPPVATVLYHAGSSPGLTVVQASAQSAIAQFSVTITTDGPLAAPTLLSATQNSEDGSTLFEWSLPPSGVPAGSSIALLGRGADGLWHTIAMVDSLTTSYSAAASEVTPYTEFALRVFPPGNGNPSPLSNIHGGPSGGGSSGLPSYAVIDLAGTPMAVASDGTVVLSGDTYLRKRGQVEESLGDLFGFVDMNDLGDIAGFHWENGAYTAYAVLANNPASAHTRWARAGHGGDNYFSTQLERINEKKTVVGSEYMVESRTVSIDFVSGTDFISNAPMNLSTIAFFSYTYDWSFERKTGATGSRYYFRDLDNHRRAVGQETDVSTNTQKPLYFGFGSGPKPTGDSNFNPFALNDDGLVLGLSNDVARLWEPLTGFRTLVLPNSVDQGSPMRVTDPPASDPDKTVVILAGDNVIFRTWKDADGQPSAFPIYTTRAAADLLPPDSPYYYVRLRNISNNGIIVAVARKVGDDPSFISDHGIMLVPLELKKCWETSNKANQVSNKTKKDDSTGNTVVLETEGDATYAVPRNNLYVVADPADNKLKVMLDVTLPERLRERFIAAAFDGTTKVQNSDKPFPAAANQPIAMEIPVTGNTAKQYEIKLGYDANNNNLLDDNEVNRVKVYKHKPDDTPRYLTVKGISNDKYAAHKLTIVETITLYGAQSQPSLIAKYARSFLSIFYYKGDFSHIGASVAPTNTMTASLHAFANGQGFAEWLTHNSGAPFSDEGVTEIKNFVWSTTSEVAEFFAQRAPFALESITNNSHGYFEFATETGTALKNFYNANVKATAESALQSGQDGDTVTFPQDGGWFECPTNIPYPFATTQTPEWVQTSSPSVTIEVGKNDGYGGWSALIGEVIGGTDEFDNYDAFGTIGRGRLLGPRYQITVKKEQTGIYRVSKILFECAIEDLYDFNYEDTGYSDIAQQAAGIQIGYGKGVGGTSRDNGLIYRHRINIRHTFDYPFDQTVILYP